MNPGTLTSALEGAFSIHVDTINALADLGYLRLMLIEREAQLVGRAREEGYGWGPIAQALQRDPTIAAMMHGHIGGDDV